VGVFYKLKPFSNQLLVQLINGKHMSQKFIVFSNPINSNQKDNVLKSAAQLIMLDRISKMKETYKEAEKVKTSFEPSDIVVSKETGEKYVVGLSGEHYTVCTPLEKPDQLLGFETQDLYLFEDEVEDSKEFEEFEIQLPSQFQIGEEVLFIPAPHKLKTSSIENIGTLARVVGVQFTGEVTYTLMIYYENGKYYDDLIERVHHSKVFPLTGK
jgi:hypothetical protein